MLEAPHKGVDGSASASLRSILFKPLAERGIESLMTRTCHKPGAVDEAFFSAEGNISHGYSVHYFRVMIGVIVVTGLALEPNPRHDALLIGIGLFAKAAL